MSRARAISRTLPWGMIAGLSVLIDWLLRRNERALREYHDLSERLDQVEQQLDLLARQPLAPAGTILNRAVTLKNGTSFEIAVDARLPDPISQAVAAGDTWFLDDYSLLLDRLRPGDRVLDLGGHIGTFGLAAAAMGCEITCVEAAPENVALLQASVARNGFAHMRVVHAAVSDQAGTLEFIPNGPWGTIANPAVNHTPALIYRGRSASSTGSALTGVAVPAVTVDELLERLGWERVNFVKLDVEGSEVAVIRGMTRLLGRPDAPALLYESNAHALAFFNQTPGDLAAVLREQGYSTYLVMPKRLVAFRPGDAQYKCVVNCLAVKGQLPRMERWHVRDAPSVEDTVRTIIAEAIHGWPYDRAYLARTLAQAEPSLLAHPQVTLALRKLRNDRDEDVRAAAAWFNR